LSYALHSKSDEGFFAFYEGGIDVSIEQQAVDLNALKFNQAAIITLVLLGFITDQWLLPAFVAAVLVAGSFDQRVALFKLTYRHVFKPLTIIKPNISHESPAPHEFAQLLGGIVLGTGSLLLALGSPIIGWSFCWLVILLAATNLFFGFCVGCFVYYQLGKLGVPGFQPRSS
jgi:hypothetical protein